jgi:hypothetical protein
MKYWFVFVSIVCDKCSSMMFKMKALRSVREILNQSSNRCTGCGAPLSSSDFVIKTTRT